MARVGPGDCRDVARRVLVSGRRFQPSLESALEKLAAACLEKVRPDVFEKAAGHRATRRARHGPARRHPTGDGPLDGAAGRHDADDGRLPGRAQAAAQPSGGDPSTGRPARSPGQLRSFRSTVSPRLAAFAGKRRNFRRPGLQHVSARSLERGGDEPSPGDCAESGRPTNAQ